MKKIHPIALKKASILSNEEMKKLFGGSGTEEDKASCVCVLLIYTGGGPLYRQPAAMVEKPKNGYACTSTCADMCYEYNTYSEDKCVSIEAKFG